MDLTLRRKLLGIVVLVALVCGPPIVIGLVFDARAREARDGAERTSESIATLDALYRRAGDSFLIASAHTRFFDAPALSSVPRGDCRGPRELEAVEHVPTSSWAARQESALAGAHRLAGPTCSAPWRRRSHGSVRGAVETSTHSGPRQASTRRADQRSEVDRLRASRGGDLASLVLALLAEVGADM